MRRVLQAASCVALAGVVLPPVLYFAGELAHETMKTLMLLATVLWFAVTPFWMNSRSGA